MKRLLGTGGANAVIISVMLATLHQTTSQKDVKFIIVNANEGMYCASQNSVVRRAAPLIWNKKVKTRKRFL